MRLKWCISGSAFLLGEIDLLQALLRGKLSRDHENIEDILTSNVFGLLKYSHPSLIFKVLSQAQFIDGQLAWDNVALISRSDVKVKNWQFWPWWAEIGCRPCEPDVVFRVEIPGLPPTEVLIEAKLNAGKSSDSDDGLQPNDQLAREWDNLRIRAVSSGSRPLLIYLTSHFSMPRAEIEASILEFERKRGTKAEIAWLSWRAIHHTLAASCTDPIQSDLHDLLERMGLTQFHGVARVIPQQIFWRFEARNAVWSVKPFSLHWRFS
jgi:hypothetical protein